MLIFRKVCQNPSKDLKKFQSLKEVTGRKIIDL